MNKELIDKIITYNYNEFGNEFGDCIVDMKKEIERLNKELTIRIQNSQYLVKQKDELEEELERLKEMKLHTEKYASEMEDKYILEKNKNNKAIEYMERYMFSQKENYDYIHLSDILKGVDKE